MKPVYDPYIKRFYVKGIGYFDNIDEARKVIDEHNKTSALDIRVSPVLYGKVKELADERGIGISEWVRQVLEKVVNENGK